MIPKTKTYYPFLTVELQKTTILLVVEWWLFPLSHLRTEDNDNLSWDSDKKQEPVILSKKRQVYCPEN